VEAHHESTQVKVAHQQRSRRSTTIRKKMVCRRLLSGLTSIFAITSWAQDQ